MLAGEAVHLGPIAGDQTYDCVQTLELVGCNFQNGTVFYESRGPARRGTKIRRPKSDPPSPEAPARRRGRPRSAGSGVSGQAEPVHGKKAQ